MIKSKIQQSENLPISIRFISAQETWPIRHQVMWPEQTIEYVKIPGDEVALHFGLFIEDRLVSIVSLFKNGNKAQFRKFATLQSEQAKGYGTRLLKHLIDYVKDDPNINHLWCNARLAKAAYYKKFGLEETAKTFQKGGIDYVVMEVMTEVGK